MDPNLLYYSKCTLFCDGRNEMLNFFGSARRDKTISHNEVLPRLLNDVISSPIVLLGTNFIRCGRVRLG